MRDKTYAFIDAANLFYGGKKSLGWKINYNKLLAYLKSKYNISKAFYYAGFETNGFDYSVLKNDQVDLIKLLKYFKNKVKNSNLTQIEKSRLKSKIQRIKFYKKLHEFGYTLMLKPTKIYKEGGKTIKKANCDVDMTLDMLRYMEQYSSAVVLSGDGDFTSVLKYLITKKRNIFVLARGERSAKEIKQLVGGGFRDFHMLRKEIEFKP